MRCGRITMDAYLALHHQVDLCLDTQPYAGDRRTAGPITSSQRSKWPYGKFGDNGVRDGKAPPETAILPPVR